jgi:hypothetical protein
MHACDPCHAIAAPAAESTLIEALEAWLPAPACPREARRWWTLARLVQTLVLMAWGGGSQGLLERFAAARGCWAQAQTALTYQGFVKAWRGAGLAPLYAAAARLREAMRASAGPAWRVGGWVALAADGSRFELPRTAAHLRAFGTSGKKRSGPQLWVTTLWHLGLGLPWAWRVGRAGSSERDHLRGMLGQTPPGCLLVLDAGFSGYALLAATVGSGRHALLRVGRSAELIRGLGYAEAAGPGRVHLWPAYARRSEQPPLALRLIRLRLGSDRRKKMYLLTSVLDEEALSDASAGELYRRRWGVELMYRSLKQTLAARKLRAHGPVAALLEVQGLMLGQTRLGRQARRAIAAAGGQPDRLTPAAALAVLRRGLRRPDQPRAWEAELALAVRDGYERRRKTRVSWPRKKRADRPPGPPKVRRARRAEIRAAAKLAAA